MKMKAVSFLCLEPTGLNFLSWKTRMLSLLESKNLKHLTFGTDTTGMNSTREYEVLNDSAIENIRHHLSSTLQNQFMDISEAKELWQLILKRFGNVKLIKPIAVSDFNGLKLSGIANVGEYYNRISEIVQLTSSIARRPNLSRSQI